MNRLKEWDMTDHTDILRRGPSVRRIARDWAKAKREESLEAMKGI